MFTEYRPHDKDAADKALASVPHNCPPDMRYVQAFGALEACYRRLFDDYESAKTEWKQIEASRTKRRARA